jgi:uncharacterized protein (DUF849 family)
MSDTPVIIEVAINGVTRREQNPSVPIEPEEIAEQALACIEAGASIVHNHIDRFGLSVDEAVERYLEGWRPVLAERPDALKYPAVHFGVEGISYEHQGPLAESGLCRVGIVDPGSVNLGGVDGQGVPAGGIVYGNSYDVIARAFEICREHGLGPSMAIYEPGFLRTAVAWWRAGRMPAGAMAKLYFSTERGYLGAPFGLPPTTTELHAFLEVLAECDLPWAVSLVGGDLVASDLARTALGLGSHLHVGLEFFGGDRQPTNVELVREAVALCEEVGRPVATPSETAAILGLP